MLDNEIRVLKEAVGILDREIDKMIRIRAQKESMDSFSDFVRIGSMINDGAKAKNLIERLIDENNK